MDLRYGYTGEAGIFGKNKQDKESSYFSAKIMNKNTTTNNNYYYNFSPR